MDTLRTLELSRPRNQVTRTPTLKRGAIDADIGDDLAAVVFNVLLCGIGDSYMMIAIQANEQGHPIVIECVDGKFREVDSERWTEILAEGDITETPQAIIPVQVMDVPQHEGHAI